MTISHLLMGEEREGVAEVDRTNCRISARARQACVLASGRHKFLLIPEVHFPLLSSLSDDIVVDNEPSGI